MTISLSLAALRGWLVLFAGLLAVGGLAAELSDDLLEFEDPLGFRYFFGLSYEENLPTWYISCLLFSCAVLLVLTALRPRKDDDPGRWHWWGLAAIFAYISLDEYVQLHENASRWFDYDGVLHYGWVIPAAAIVLVIGLFYIPFLLRLSTRTRWRFVLAGAVYVGGALGMELPLGYWASNWGSSNLGYGLIDLVEETMEIAGISIFFYALVEHLLKGPAALRISLAATPDSSEQGQDGEPTPRPHGLGTRSIVAASFGAQVLRTLLVMSVVLIVWLATMQILQSFEYGRRIAGPELQSLVADRTLYGAFDTESGGETPWVQYFAPSGEVLFTMDDELHRSSWRIEGDRLCFRTEDDDGAQEDCLRVYEQEEVIQLVLPTLATFGHLVAIATRSAAGDTEGLTAE